MSVLPVGIAASGDEGYTLDNSLRFRSSASAYLTRTPSSAGNRKTFTISFWHKKAKTAGFLFAVRNSSGGAFFALKTSSDTFNINDSQNSDHLNLTTTQVFRDVSAWYHIVVAIDTTQATSSNRAKLYVNGEQVTSFSTSSYPAQNADMMVNSTIGHYIGCSVNLSGTPTLFIDAYLTEINFIDGQALTADDFGEFDEDTGVWKPKAYSGTYGTNGFYLPTTATTQADGFNTVLYTGTAATQSIKTGFAPDLVWLKSRTAAYSHALFDSVRGTSKWLTSNGTNAEATVSGVTAFNSDGFTIGSDTGQNNSGTQYVAWCWDAGSNSPASNTDGDITSTVKANTATGFSIVSYTGDGSASSTVGHGLSSSAEMIFVKDLAVTNNWRVWHKDLSANNWMYLNLTNAQASAATDGGLRNVNATTFGFINGTTAGVEAVNTSGRGYIAYCWHSVAGYSKFGSYTGTGSSGNTVTTGFRPAWVMMKSSTNASTPWQIFDNTREPQNPVEQTLIANNSNAEPYDTVSPINFTDTGFELLGNTSSWNNYNTGTWIYMAFADTRDAQFNFDASGNKNNFTANNINSNASSEASYDIMTDVPTLTDEYTANYCTWNPLSETSNLSTSEANLAVANSITESTHRLIRGTMGMSTGKYYWEVNVNNSANVDMVGIINSSYAGTDATTVNASNGFGYGYNTSNGNWYNGTGWTTDGTTPAAFPSSGIIGVAFDADNGKLYFSRNNTWINSANPSAGTGANGTYTGSETEFLPALSIYSNTGTWRVNFGQRPFAYTPPTGFKALNTYNLPDSTIVDGSEHFNTVLYSGSTASEVSVTGVGFQPDLVWDKNRSNAYNHYIWDAVRGATKYWSSNLTTAETTDANSLKSFDSDGFTLGAGSTFATMSSGNAHVGWAWKGNNGTVSNTDGSITTTVSANTTAGISIFTYTGSGGASDTLGHGLGVAPEWVFVHDLSSATFTSCYHIGTHPTVPASYLMRLNTTDARLSSSVYWNNTKPTSSVVTIGTSSAINDTNNYVMYCFAPVEGFSAFGSYTGNGSSDGPFIYTGFRPAWVLIKEASSTGSWVMLDTTRSTYNVINNDSLWANLNSAEGGSASYFDMLSNGFKIRDTDSDKNTSGQTYIYSAFAENPFKNSLAR